MEVKQLVSSSGHTNQRAHPQLSLNTSAGNKDMHAWCCEAEYSQQSTQGPLFWFQDLVNISLSLPLFYNIIYVFTFTLSGSVSHTCCCWLGFLLRRLQWGRSWWRWGSWQSAAAAPPEQPTGSQPHPLLRAGRYHSGRKEERGSAINWDKEWHTSQEDIIKDSRGSWACSTSKGSGSKKGSTGALTPLSFIMLSPCALWHYISQYCSCPYLQFA